MIHFADMSRSLYTTHPIQKASRVDGYHKKTQLEKYGRETFVDCPGIFDYKNTGWIMPAWDEIKIYCSEKSTMVYMGSGADGKRSPVWNKSIRGFQLKNTGSNMSDQITDGIPIASGCPMNKPLQPIHLISPWRVETDEEFSLLCLPPYYHSDFVKNFEVFPGIVDFNTQFDTLNVIASPRTTGTFIIKAGTPLMQLIPIHKSVYNTTYGPAKKFGKMTEVVASCKNFYRKYVMRKSKYNLELVENEK